MSKKTINSLQNNRALRLQIFVESGPDDLSIGVNLWKRGFSRLGRLLGEDDCVQLRQAYFDDSLFRSRIDMSRFRFGEGEYKYFSYPLPPLIADLRMVLYSQLVKTAAEWMTTINVETTFPPTLGGFLKICADAGQTRPTPLMLHYQKGGFNCLHQDLYGKIYFPFQVIICLSEPEVEFTGGELILVEQRPRSQSIPAAIILEQGEAVVITTRFRPVKGTRGYYRTQFRHGVSLLTQGERFVLGLVFHDAS